MKSPTVSTLKTLFALSRNQCAFPKCMTRLVEEPSGTLVGKVCHIKGKSSGPGSKRHDMTQTDAERHGIGNLIALCPKHHDVVDDDEESYTVERLLKMKADHEASMQEEPDASASLAEKFAVAIYNNTVIGGSVIHVENQTGGQSGSQIAHTIHNNYGVALQPLSAFRAELVRRHMSDVDDPEFARTFYSKRMGLLQDKKIVPLRTTAVVFAHSPIPILTAADEAGFIQWADCNKLRYEPCETYPFIPSPMPDRVGSAIVWNDARFSGLRGYDCYVRYIAIERAGWIEYGFCPSDPFEDTLRVYYARIVGNIMGFLQFIQQVAKQRALAPSTFSLGIGLRGINGTSLEAITRRLMREYGGTTPLDRDAFLALRSADNGPWEPEGVGIEFADAMLNHWVFSRPGWFADTPEFEAGAYKGEAFKEYFQRW